MKKIKKSIDAIQEDIRKAARERWGSEYQARRAAEERRLMAEQEAQKRKAQVKQRRAAELGAAITESWRRWREESEEIQKKIDEIEAEAKKRTIQVDRAFPRAWGHWGDPVSPAEQVLREPITALYRERNRLFASIPSQESQEKKEKELRQEFERRWREEDAH
jgi:hypothetical protein